MDRADIVHDAFVQALTNTKFPSGADPSGPLEDTCAIEIFQAQCISRNLDRTSRKMQASGQGYYTIGSSGHEGMAAVAAALRPTDMAFLHYRDGAFQTMRSAQVAGIDPVRDMLLSFATSTADPISGGRHKVLGSRALNIPPQTSTIASHLPKAVGAAYSIGLARRRTPEHKILEDDGIVICSFGDASSNHSTAQGAINSACWAAYQSTPLPLVFVCEDNGIGISTRTPKGWIAENFKSKPGLKYIHANGLDLYDTYRAAKEAAAYARTHKKPVFLHLTLVRLYGHAGSDLQQAYLPKTTFEQWEADDPLLHSARLLDQSGALASKDALKIYTDTAARCQAMAQEIAALPRLETAQDVMQSLIPPARPCLPKNGPSDTERLRVFGSDIKAMDTPQPMARLLNWALRDIMLDHPEVVMMGEDIGRKGGVYGVTQKLADRFGADRVIDSLLDEQSILGLAIGMAHNGFVPIPEIQFLAYLHNAEDQIRGEAATLPFFSNGQFSNPMVLRIAGLGYQKGFGGHFHNDNSLAVLRDIPGIVIACPSRGDDAAMMLRECVRLAREEQRVVVFVEPIALYPMRDLHDNKDAGWMTHYPAPDRKIPLGSVGVDGDGPLAILTYGNGRYLSSQAARKLDHDGLETRIIDIRWLAPLPTDAILQALHGAQKVLIVDECRETGSQSEALMAFLHENCAVPHARIAAHDSFIATGPAYAATMPSADSIAHAAKALWDMS
ncbi:MFS transporter [Shimia litoralis]|uniref:2-oxoglutarate dehydrogenase E1 component n=1 Tax=Shimia litoralis TaxID=420403 RepID=A0A4U7NA93_9RHOB|nr:thiamine pyrophosphate-dependent enzyme [Shimia litoralis]TKZ22386.1 MFS transporter [Shimia litoralis]